MAKWPIVRTTESGNKVYRITCAESGVEFEHEQVGRGRPPVYSPEVRKARAAAAKPKQARVGRPKKEAVLTIASGAIQTGDTVVRPLRNFFASQESAVKYATPLFVTAVIGDVAYVQHPDEKAPLATALDRLVKVGRS